MKVLGYARLSNETEASTSIERQHEAITDYAQRKGWDLVGIEVDPFASATKTRLDRIARSVVDFGTLLDEGINVVSATEPLDTTTPMGRAMAEILQVFAAMESAATKARVTDSVAHLRRIGRFPGGRVPYGYRTAPHPSGSGRALEIDPDAAREVRRWADGVLSGQSLYSLTKDTTTSLDTARGVLVGEAVLGRVVHKGDVLRDDHGLPLEVWPPILTAAESRELRVRLARQRPGQSRRKASALLSKMLHCGTCNGVMYASAGHYRCVPTKGRTCAAPVRVKGELVEAEVAGRFLAVVGDWPYLEEQVLAAEPAELVDVEEAIRATSAALVEDGADMTALVERLVALKARREELRSRPAAPETRLVDTGRTFREHWDATEDTGARRGMLARAVEYVAVDKAAVWSADRVTVGWREGGART